MTIVITTVIIISGSSCSAASDRKNIVQTSVEAVQQPILLGCNITEGYVFTNSGAAAAASPLDSQCNYS